jgi:hypothetical protein
MLLLRLDGLGGGADETTREHGVELLQRSMHA